MASVSLAIFLLGGPMAAVSSKAISIPPSEFFIGDDGRWSTFWVTLGTPRQSVQLLPGTSATAANMPWVIQPEGCTGANANITDCASIRGGLFARNQSTSWLADSLGKDVLYSLVTYEESILGLYGTAYYGFDDIQLGLVGSGMPIIGKQLIAAYQSNDWFVGYLGLSPYAFNFSTSDAPIPSLIGNLVNRSAIPGPSWGYTAGAAYLETPVYGSLTLGGYDKARIDSSNTLHDVPFGPDISRDLVVQLLSITYDSEGTTLLSTEPISIFIDSMVTELWLPVAVCEQFEKAFNLTWNDTASFYLIDDFVHATLAAHNPTFQFKLSSPSNISGPLVSISIPYAALDLTASAPLYPSGSRYFPLKQAQNSTQYTLGRAFLQAAYVTADYDKQSFSVAQALFPIDWKAVDLVTIGGSPAPGLSKAAIAGIAVGGAIVLIFLVLITVWLIRKRRRRQQGHLSAATAGETQATLDVAEEHYNDKHDAHELKGSPAQQYGGKHDSYELRGSPAPQYDPRGSLLSELSADGRYQHRGSARYELAGTPVNEVPGSSTIFELRETGER
ncbi:hypothetical protein B0A48_01466 [Cryoendolithus antarcticus]|uniref:Peptidase A1 domain-containing protein n=1 Tax=Cryoendolithus antarcticus TaxID=1507870 RepID=A0A1V8TPR0_9PEZI|nr:hypothetical protein B0A48_01466 [Cryoendolithus antarcticus]